MADAAGVTGLLLAWSSGDETARDRLFHAVYQELRQVASARLRGERPDFSLAPTALVHEAYLKLIDQRRVQWQNRAHFFAIALDAALAKLASVDRRQSELVELRFFAGLTVEETAAALDVAPITVKRDWALAKAWLFRELQGLGPQT
jgi:DNA-directed RNA polymerase specialized sigma24 family protein